jgi:hypothetical protein
VGPRWRAPFHPGRIESSPVESIALEMCAALDAVDPATGRPASQGGDFRALIAAARARATI